MSTTTWLPNLVAGTSIWKLAVDLNEAKFFDGRLLVPETEGSESLPVTVRWDLSGLVPLEEARAAYPEAVLVAVKDFEACLDRVAKVFATPNSGYDKYKEAFTVPSLEGDGATNYFYSPSANKLFVIHWGASPRAMGGRAEYVFGYEDWGKRWGGLGAAVVTGDAPTGVGVGAGAGVGASAEASGAPPEAADDARAGGAEKATESKRRAWWVWPLFGLVAITLVLLALFLLKACREPKVDALSDASADATSATEDADGSAANGTDVPDDDVTHTAASLDGGDGADDAASDGGNAGASEDAAANEDAGANATDADDAGHDAGGALSGDGDDDDMLGSSSGGGGGGASGGGGGPDAPIEVKIGPGGGAKTGTHRKHYSDAAAAWRVASGNEKISRTEQRGRRFDVWLSPGQTFEGVRVEWQDKAGAWHVH